MISVNKTIKNRVAKIKRSMCTNNTQRVLLSLLRATTKDGWVPNTQIANVPSSAARVRDLRKTEFGGFTVECSRDRVGSDQVTFYRVMPKSVTLDALNRVFKGVISTQ